MPGIIIGLIMLAFYLVVSYTGLGSADQYMKPNQVELPMPTLALTSTPTPIPPKSQIANKKPVQSGQDWSVTKLDELTTDSQYPADARMATADELFVAINEYRKTHNINQLQKSDTLCTIAQTRANQLLVLGKLDDHAGFSSLVHNQQEFNSMGEIIQGGKQPNYAVHIVEWGWGRSLTGHAESMRDPKWQYRCGGVAGYFSVFVFGQK